MASILDREEYIEQAYFFRVFRERILENVPAQDALDRLHEEILSSTRLPMAVQFLAGDLRHTGLLSTGMERLQHYFHPFQTFVIRQSEQDASQFTTMSALLILEREALYRSGQPTSSGLFVYQFEAICRNRLGYVDGLTAMADDPFYSPAWKTYLNAVRRQVGIVDFADLVYLRSKLFVADQKRQIPSFESGVEMLFEEKEGKIAKASRGRDPLFLFAALQRQLNYPEVPRPRPKNQETVQMDTVLAKLRELEARLKLAEGELRGNVDLTQFAPESLPKDDI